MQLRYLGNFLVRISVFVAVFLTYLIDRPLMVAMVTTPFFRGFTLMHVLWFLFMITMLMHIFPLRRLTMALLKGEQEHFRPVEQYGRLELLEYVHQANLKAWLVMMVWLCFNGIWGLLYLSGVIETTELVMLTVFYYLSDYICILLFCPFQTYIMKNKCCVNCRIYDWGHFMMFTPMLFIKNFFSWSLFFTSCVVLIRWELIYAKYPQRFWEGSNQTLQCAHCKDKTCMKNRGKRING